jgi:ABC-type transporter Mla MlaB component
MARTARILDCSSLREPDLATIDCLARLQLLSRREGFELRLQHASTELRELIDFAGLGGVLGVEPLGQAEEGEEPHGVKEERELHDPPV